MVVTSPDGGSRLKGFLVGLFVLAVIVLVAFAVIVRTEGAKEIIEKKLGNWLGVKVSVSGTGIVFPYVLEIRDIVTEGFEDDGKTPGLIISKLRVGLSGKTVKMVVENGRLYLVQGRDGNWEPSVFRRMGELPLKNISELSSIVSGFRKGPRLELERCSVEWLPFQANMASADGIDFRLVPVKAPGRRMFYHRLSVSNTLHPDGSRSRNVSIEWLASGQDEYIMLGGSLSGSSEGAMPFWSPGDKAGE